MRATFLAVLMNANSPASIVEARDLAYASLRKDDYMPWEHPTPKHYQPGPREIMTVGLALKGPFALFQPSPEKRAPQWALELSRSPRPRAVVLYMGPEIDQVPGVGPVLRGGKGDGALLKVYANHEPWLKIGTAEDVEVPYPIPSIVSERSDTVIEKLAPYLGAAAADFTRALKKSLEDGTPSPENILAALGLSRVFPLAESNLRLIRSDSPLFRKAPPSPTGREKK